MYVYLFRSGNPLIYYSVIVSQSQGLDLDIIMIISCMFLVLLVDSAEYQPLVAD